MMKKVCAAYVLLLLGAVMSYLLVGAGCRSVPPAETAPPAVEGEEKTPTTEEKNGAEAEEGSLIMMNEMPEEQSDEALPVLEFGEIWAYVRQGREKYVSGDLPVSDMLYFAAEVNSYGELVGVPSVQKLRNRGFTGRVHLTFACFNTALSHFILVPDSPLRARLIHDLVEAAKPFAGLNIDMENVPERDAEAFLSFLRDLRSRLKGKMFTIALAAHPKREKNYNYRKIAPLVDRIFVMAYDEHGSWSRPGPVASFSWCNQVSNDSIAIVGEEKIIMGMPFYGYSWAKSDAAAATSAIHFGQATESTAEMTITSPLRRENGILTWSYRVPVTVTIFYDDARSIVRRAEMYQRNKVRYIGFWTLGQEDEAVWNYFKVRGKT